MKRKKCELCEGTARMHCESDQASLCWSCDSKVHSANFLVARHSRTLLCHVCLSPTRWTAAGSKLCPTVSVCDNCLIHCRRADEDGESLSDAGNADDDDYDEEEEDDDQEEEEVDDNGDNQVVPWCPSTPPPNSEEDEEESSYTSSSSARRQRINASDMRRNAKRELPFTSDFGVLGLSTESLS